jgi:hypothetical protein
LSVAVALFLFNRPELTRRVFAQIRRYRPSILLIVGDGPRTHEEAALCNDARKVADEVDWHCDVRTNFSISNLGCRRRISSGLDWVFGECEEAIVLEDDCLPDETFFPFCAELLERYRTDERVMAISGDNFQLGIRRTPYSYYYSRNPHCWGWASWRRAWQHYDVDMNLWPELRKTNWLSDLLSNPSMEAFWRGAFDATRAGKVDTWDFQWTFACWAQNALAVLPEGNLVSNIGYGSSATHTSSADHPYANLTCQPMSFPLRHPPYVMRNRDADLFTFLHEMPLASSATQRMKDKVTSRLYRLRIHVDSVPRT